MVVHSVFIVSKSGGLIYSHEHNVPKVETERLYTFPLPFQLEERNKRVIVAFGEQGGVKVGHCVSAINKVPVNGHLTGDNKPLLDFMRNEQNYPLTIKFAKTPVSTNEKIFLASMFYSLYAIACQLSPEQKSSGIKTLECDTFLLQCLQTVTGVKFVVVSDTKQNGGESLLRRMHELYSDFAMKNPFYSLEMPVVCELFDEHLVKGIELVERTGTAFA
ncbi:unnamed protein product [Notodromas monacha]|uniref:Trafficking protein particle complex subunit n=1 Tax=Notodromas monacha TaxID=399045 RepID=A0A7R9BG88_9CRUS|nr:unnamed protein product [Notodromas monacha]CAG0913546.1 unnamed protein product [Notodromas monacha]